MEYEEITNYLIKEQDKVEKLLKNHNNIIIKTSKERFFFVSWKNQKNGGIEGWILKNN